MGNFNRLLSGDIEPEQSRAKLFVGANAEEWTAFEQDHMELRDTFEDQIIDLEPGQGE